MALRGAHCSCINIHSHSCCPQRNPSGFLCSDSDETQRIDMCTGVWYYGVVRKLHSQRQENPAGGYYSKTAGKIIGCPLPSLENIATSRGLNRAKTIMSDPSHPGHGFFQLLPSGRRYRSLGSRTNRLRNTFYPWAIRLLNA